VDAATGMERRKSCSDEDRYVTVLDDDFSGNLRTVTRISRVLILNHDDEFKPNVNLIN